MSWLKNFAVKVGHGLVPAVGAIVPLLVAGVTAPVTLLTAGGGALLAYLCKPARPATPPETK